MADRTLVLGTFTHGKMREGDPDVVPSEGVELYRFDDATGAITYVDTATGLESPSFVAFHPKLSLLYVAERPTAERVAEAGSLTTMTLEDGGRRLAAASSVPSGGVYPVHVSVHRSGGHAYLAHYTSGEVVAFLLDGSGIPKEMDACVVHEGGGPHERQEQAHPHQARPSLDGKFLYVADLGCDSVTIYPTGEDGALSTTPAHVIELPKGNGPRHVAFHPNGSIVFVICELESVLHLVRLGANGLPTGEMHSYRTIPDDYRGHNAPAEVVLARDGATAYVSNRGHNTIANFHIDAEAMTADLIGHQDTLGVSPRNFNVDPTERYLVVANTHSSDLSVFAIDDKEGIPRPIGEQVAVRSPACVLFSPYDARAVS